MAGPPRRAPFPFDFILNSVGLMGGRSGKGADMVATKPNDMSQVAPAEYDYSAMPPAFGRIQPYAGFPLGFGLPVQEKFKDLACNYCENVDTSAGPWLKGPDITPVTLPWGAIPAQPVTHIVKLAGSLYAIAGRCVFKCDLPSPPSWSLSKDFGSGKAAVDAIVFRHNTGSGSEVLYVAMGDSETVWRYDGSTPWEQHVQVQSVTIANTPTGGHYHLSHNTDTTGEIAYNADGAAVQTALRLLPGLSGVTVSTSGSSPNYTHTITFTGAPGSSTMLTCTNSLTDADMGTQPNPTITVARVQARLLARAWGIVGREFYRALDSNKLSKVDTDADPWNEANWGAQNQFYVGDHSSVITRLAVTATGTLLIYKTDGIYTLGPGGEYYALYPQLKMAKDDDNGKAHAGWLNDEWVAYGGGLYRIGQDFSIRAAGPELAIANNSPVKGRITALAGHNTFNLYALLHNSDTDDSYLMKYGAWVNSDGNPEAQRLEAWHGSISPAFVNKHGTAMATTDVGAPSDHWQMYLGFDDGTLAFFTLPCSPNPAACGQYDFSTADGYLYGPKAHFLFEADQKAILGLTLESLSAGATAYTQFEYKTDTDDGYVALGSDFVQPLQYANFPNGTGTVWFDWRLVLKNTLSTVTPQVVGLGIHHAVRPSIKLIYQFLVLAVDGLIKRDGTRMRLGAAAIKKAVKDEAGRVGVSTLLLPDEQSVDLLLTGYKEATAWDERNKQWRAALSVEGVQFQINSLYGTYGRLKAYTYGELAAYTYGQIKSL